MGIGLILDCKLLSLVGDLTKGSERTVTFSS